MKGLGVRVPRRAQGDSALRTIPAVHLAVHRSEGLIDELSPPTQAVCVDVGPECEDATISVAKLSRDLRRRVALAAMRLASPCSSLRGEAQSRPVSPAAGVEDPPRIVGDTSRRSSVEDGKSGLYQLGYRLSMSALGQVRRTVSGESVIGRRQRRFRLRDRERDLVHLHRAGLLPTGAQSLRNTTAGRREEVGQVLHSAEISAMGTSLIELVSRLVMGLTDALDPARPRGHTTRGSTGSGHPQLQWLSIAAPERKAPHRGRGKPLRQ